MNQMQFIIFFLIMTLTINNKKYVIGIILTLMLISVSSTFADVVHPIPEVENYIEISKLGADSNGQTSFSTVQVEWREKEFFTRFDCVTIRYSRDKRAYLSCN